MFRAVVVCVFVAALCVSAQAPFESFVTLAKNGRGPQRAERTAEEIRAGTYSHGPVTTLPGYGKLKVESHAGYVPVKPEDHSYLYYWLWESENDPANDPLVFWLQGGPGCSSIGGLFQENGPLKFKGSPDEYVEGSTPELEDNPYGWNQKATMVWIDQPVGTGFSVTDPGTYRSTEDALAEDFVEGVLQLYQQHPKLVGLKVFLSGESYAGKYIPSIATAIMNHNRQSGVVQIPLEGLLIGDGWTHPLDQNRYGPPAFTFGLVTEAEYALSEQQYAQCRNLIQEGNFGEANNVCNEVLNTVLTAGGNPNVYDLRTYTPYSEPRLHAYLNRADVQAALYVDHSWADCDNAPGNALSNDIQQSVRDLIPDLLDNYRVLFYNGQWDLICNQFGVQRYLAGMKWAGQKDYLTATHKTWKVEGDVAGLVRGPFKNMTQLIVHNCGHLCPMNQGKNTLFMLNTFTAGASFSE